MGSLLSIHHAYALKMRKSFYSERSIPLDPRGEMEKATDVQAQQPMKVSQGQINCKHFAHERTDADGILQNQVIEIGHGCQITAIARMRLIA